MAQFSMAFLLEGSTVANLKFPILSEGLSAYPLLHSYHDKGH